MNTIREVSMQKTRTKRLHRQVTLEPILKTNFQERSLIPATNDLTAITGIRQWLIIASDFSIASRRLKEGWTKKKYGRGRK